MNTCPVVPKGGGLSYGSTFSGPIGVIIDPTFNLASTARCPSPPRSTAAAPACPVKINIHEQIYKWRQIIAERHQLPMASGSGTRRRQDPRERGSIASRSRPRQPASNATRFMVYNPFNAWGRQREVPQAPQSTFRQWYVSTGGGR
jgi:L-lactate dehydrogenase complex protein LldF